MSTGARKRRLKTKDVLEDKYPLQPKMKKHRGKRLFNAVSLLYLFLAFLLVFFCYNLRIWYMKRLLITPFDINQPLKLNHSTTKWNTLRSNVYFGMKSMGHHSLISGLMWFRNVMEQNTVPIRHWCNQFDRLEKYTWLKHDFKSFGVQEIIDKEIIIKTKYITNDDDSWTARISFSSNISEFQQPISMLWYFATDDENDLIEVVSKKQVHPDEMFNLKGTSVDTGCFIASVGIRKNFENVVYRGFLNTVSKAKLINLKETVLRNMFLMRTKPMKGVDGNILVLRGDAFDPNEHTNANFIAHQIFAYLPFEVEINYKTVSDDLIANNEHLPALPFNEQFDEEYNKREREFDESFEQKFNLGKKGFGADYINFGKSVLSNMLGSIGYFYGYSLVKSKYYDKPVRYGPLELLTAVPSRSFFPRGFLWDEGFHNLLISKYDPELSISVVRSWMNLMNAEGWIPREVVLGIEAEARVPREFVVQKNTNANPPTLFLTLESMLDAGSISDKVLEELFPRLETWYQWFNTSQLGEIPSTYRWRGRDANTTNELNPKTLTSGLDDYPRASHPTDSERHIDLRCWMILSSRVMARIAQKISHSAYDSYQSTAEYLSDNVLLDALHWSDDNQMYCDFGMHSNNVKLVKSEAKDKPVHRIVKSEPIFSCVREFGYISIFPFMLNILKPNSRKLGRVLIDLENSDHLWTPFGLRSLSKTSSYYKQYNTESDPPYWRGSIWINMNYLTLKALKYYSIEVGPYQSQSTNLYKKLRHNLIENIYSQYKKTGYIWEQYDDDTGVGKGSHPFTGWSALVLLMMSEDL